MVQRTTWRKGHVRLGLAWTGLFAWALAAVAACSGSTGSVGQSSCMPDETLRDGRCVPARDGSHAANGSDGAAALDSEIGPTPDSSSDSTLTDDASDDGDTSLADDGAEVGDAIDAQRAEPCFDADNVILECNHSSCPSSGSTTPCETCGATTTTHLMTSGAFRTPSAPGVDPLCAAACPDGGFVYAMAFTIDRPWMGEYLVQVKPPWRTFSGSATPFCPDYGTQNSISTNVNTCLIIYPFSDPSRSTFYVVTDDPNASPANVTVAPSHAYYCP